MKSCHGFPILISNQKLFPDSQHGPEFSAKVVSPHLTLTNTKGEVSGTVLIVMWDHLHGRMSSVICNCKSLVQNIINLGKCRNYFHLSGMISLLHFCHVQTSSMATPAAEHRAAALLCTHFPLSLLTSFSGGWFCNCQRIKTKNVGLELQMWALNNLQDDTMHFCWL